MDVFTQLRKLGHDPSRRAELREHCKLNMKAILQGLPGRVLSSEGADILDCLLNGIPETPASSLSYKGKVLDIVLGRLRSEATSLTLCGQLVSRLRLELPRAPAEDVVRRADESVHSLVHDEDVNMIWRDILPECLSVLSERGRLVHCGTDMSAEEYKEQCVRTLCQCRWRERCVVQLAAMFRDMHLDREAHLQVVTKLCTVMLDLPPDSVPPLLLQLLKLCKSQHTETVLAYLSRYFNTTLYGRLAPAAHDSDSTHMDVEEFGGHTASELTECVSTCVYHAVSTAPEQLMKALKGWPRTRLLREPFLLEATLALSAGSAHRAACLALARAAVQQRCADEQRAGGSAWLRAVLPAGVDVTRVLKVLVAESTNHRQLTAPGLLELAFHLLAATPQPGRERAALRCWRCAELLLVRLARAQPETAPHVLGRLADRLCGARPQRQYADCLLVLCKLTPLALERCIQLCTIIENCQASSTDFRSAAAVLDAVQPILKFSSRVRDTLVMVCRKGLFSRDSPSRCLALWGLLGLLRHTKLPAGGGGDSCSDQYSVNSYLTQISIDLHSTQLGGSVSHVRNEAVCREVVSILRRCLTQDSAVKQLLYANIYRCTRQKRSLHESVLDLLYEQLAKYVSSDERLDLERCVQLTATGAVLTEPIGYLLLAVQQFLQAPDQDDSDDILMEDDQDAAGAKYFKDKLTKRMDDLCEKYQRFTLADFDMEGEHGLTDPTPESRARSLRAQQALQLCEALASYRVLRWSRESDAPAQKLYALYTLHNQLLQHAKTPSKVTKKGKAALNETGKETQKTQKTQKTGKDKGKGPVKLASLVREKAVPFKPLPCLWDLGVCCRVLELLYSEEVAWSTPEQRAQLRTRRDFHQFALASLQSVLAADDTQGGPTFVAHTTRAASILYKNCILRFQGMCDFHEPTALASVEAFRACLDAVAAPRRRADMLAFLRQVTGESDASAGDCVAAVLQCALLGLRQLDSELDGAAPEPDAASRRLAAALAHLASLALDELEAPPSERLDSVIEQLEQLLRTARMDCLALVPSLLSASCRSRQDGRLLDDLIVKLTAVLGQIDEEEEAVPAECEMFPAIDEAIGHTVFGHVCAHVTAQCGRVELALQRARDLDAARKYVTHHDTEKLQNELTELDKAAVVQLCQAGGRVVKLASLRCAVGAGSDRALQAAVRLYGPLTALVTRAQRSPAAYVHTIRLERALAACGRRLSGALDDLISYVESSQPAHGKDKCTILVALLTPIERDYSVMVLRETRLVPRLVFMAEQFSKHVIILANKTKLNLQQHLSLGTARDFRIKAAVLEEALRGQAPAADLELDDTSTVVLSPGAAEGMEVEGSGEEEGEGSGAEEGERSDGEGEARPSSKRRRLSAR